MTHKGAGVELRPANAGDLDLVDELLREASAWMRSTLGVHDQWPERFPRAMLEAALAAGELHVAMAGSETVGTLRISSNTSSAWNDDIAEALYVSSLCIRRTQGGAGLGSTLLDAVQARGTREGRPLLRLDCLATNRRLCAYYERLGFEPCGTVELVAPTGERWTAARYERGAHR